MVSPGHVVAASYRYDPFGNLVSKSGPLADANVYRFSSKELHVNSGLYYYGYRFYSPNLQRWVNRDPIGERGGMNLYGFVGNNPVKYLDPDGLFYWGDDDDFPTLPTGSVLDSYVWDPALAAEIKAKENQALDELISLGMAAGTMAASMCPGVGEAMDAATLADRGAAWWERGLAGGSLCLNGMAGGVLPNYSAFRAAAKSGENLLAFTPKLELGNAKYGLEHILRRHSFNTGAENVSKFSQGMGHIEIEGLINEAAQSGTAWQVQGGSRVLDANMGRIVGIDQAGNAVSGLRVVTDSTGRVITTYPIPAP